jgi:hypothetical protein
LADAALAAFASRGIGSRSGSAARASTPANISQTKAEAKFMAASACQYPSTFFISAMAAFSASLTCTPLKPKKLTRRQVRLAQAA